MAQFKKIGKIKDAFGIKGEIYVLIFSGDWSWRKQLKSFSLSEGEGDALQTEIYEVVSVRPHREGLVLRVRGIEDRNMAEKLKGRDFAVEEGLFVSRPGEGIYLSEILNFEVLMVSEAMGATLSKAGRGPEIEEKQPATVTRSNGDHFGGASSFNSTLIGSTSSGSVSIGSIVAFSSNGAQDLLVIQGERGIFEVPFVKDFIVQLDFPSRKLYLDLPAGLLEINISK